MGRRIKFRYVWQRYDGHIWVEIVPLECLEGAGDRPFAHTFNEEGLQEYWALLSRDEFTGLHDKDGEEIYEGDVIEDPDFGPDSGCVIEFENGAFYANAILDPDDGSNDLASDYAPAAVRVGNIHEHPELLK